MPSRAGRLDVGHHLCLERVDALEFPLRTDPLEEFQPERLLVEIAGEVEQEGFDPVLILAEGRAVADVHDGVGRPAVPRRPGQVHPGCQHERAVWLEIGGGKTQRAPSARAAPHGTADGVRMAQELRGPDRVARAQELAYRARGHRLALEAKRRQYA